MTTTNSSSIQVIDRLVDLLDVIARYDEPVSLKILAAETGLHPSTAHRILAALGEHGLVERSDNGHYHLGSRLLTFASRVQGSSDPRREALPTMEWLRGELGETVNLTVREGDVVIYVERALSHKAMRVEQVIGSRAPLHVTAVGKLFLGYEGEAACRAYATRQGLTAYTVNTLVDVDALCAAACQASAQGFAYDDEEAELGVGCIAVPIFDVSGTMIAGLSVSAPIQRRQTDWLPRVIEAGRRISARLGYHEDRSNHLGK